MNIRNIYLRTLLSIFTAITLFSCVDDFEDANPPRLLDGPFGFPKLEGAELISTTDLDNTAINFLPLNSEAQISVSIVDAPGVIESATYSLNNIVQPEPLGTLSLDISGVKDKEKGTLVATYTTGDVPGDETITITVVDRQGKKQDYTFEVRIANTDCFSNTDLSGFYNTVASGFNSEAGADYTNLEYTTQLYFRPGTSDNPGYYRMRNASFGLYAEQGYSEPFANLTVCGNQISTPEPIGADQLEYTGTVNGDGTISISWSNVYGDTGDVVLTPQ